MSDPIRITALFDSVRGKHATALSANLALYRGGLPIASPEEGDLLDAAVRASSRACVLVLLRAGYDPRPCLAQTSSCLTPGVRASLRAAAERWDERQSATARLFHALRRHDTPAVLTALAGGGRVDVGSEERRARGWPDLGPLLSQAVCVAREHHDARAFHALLAAGAPDTPGPTTAAHDEQPLAVALYHADTEPGAELALALLASPSPAPLPAKAVQRALICNAMGVVLDALAARANWEPESADVTQAAVWAAPQPMAWLLARRSWPEALLTEAGIRLGTAPRRPSASRAAATAAALLRCPPSAASARSRPRF